LIILSSIINLAVYTDVCDILLLYNNSCFYQEAHLYIYIYIYICVCVLFMTCAYSDDLHMTYFISSPVGR
jgi:hypothetical protein